MSERERRKVSIKDRPVSPPPPLERDAVWQEHQWRMQAQDKCEQLAAENDRLRARVHQLSKVAKAAKKDLELWVEEYPNTITTAVIDQLAAVLRETDVDTETGRE